MAQTGQSSIQQGGACPSEKKRTGDLLDTGVEMAVGSTTVLLRLATFLLMFFFAFAYTMSAQEDSSRQLL